MLVFKGKNIALFFFLPGVRLLGVLSYVTSKLLEVTTIPRQPQAHPFGNAPARQRVERNPES